VKEELLFCEQKRSKKNFVGLMWRRPRHTRPQGSKSLFGSFSSEKEHLASFGDVS
jgi:hypothetical protein